jgi:hypothetical protein
MEVMDMKKLLKPICLPWITAGLGAAAFISAFWLLRTGEDSRMLLNPTHPGAILLWVLSLLMTATALLLVQPLVKGKLRYDRAFPASVSGAVGIGLGGAGMAFTGINLLLSAGDPILVANAVTALLGAASMFYLAFCRFTGSRPHFLALCVVLVFLMLQILCRYRVWSAEPELLRYLFPMAGLMLLSLAMFQRLAFVVGMGNRWLYVLFSMLGSFFALAALPGDNDRWLLAGLCAWALTDHCSLRVRKPRKKPEVRQ